MSRVFIILLAVAFISVSDAPERLAWNSNRVLQWSDFKGTPDSLEQWAASSSTGISQEYASDGEGYIDKESLMVTAHFYPEYSWVRHQEKSKHLLAHEQTHFNITEVYARKLKDKVAAYAFTSNSLEEIKMLYKEVEEERIATQQLFDKETNHSINHMKEVQWELKVAAWLRGDFKD